MIISATVTNEGGQHHTTVQTGDKQQTVSIPAKTEGQGSSVNGGELLFLALATCYCNDIYREAKERGIHVASVQVEVTGRFGGKGDPAEDICYRATVKSDSGQEEILALIHHTDAVAEIHNTLRRATPVVLEACEAVHLG